MQTTQLTKEEADLIQEDLDILRVLNPPIISKTYPWTERQSVITDLINLRFNREYTELTRFSFEFNILLHYLLSDGLISKERYDETYYTANR